LGLHQPFARTGLSIGILQAQILRRALREHADDPLAFATAYDAETEGQAAPFYHGQINADRARVAEIAALLEGRAPLPPDPEISAFFAAAMHDADVFRALIESVVCVSPAQEVMKRPQVGAMMAEFEGRAPAPARGIDRDHFQALVAG
jgi:hypothetical protein